MNIQAKSLDECLPEAAESRVAREHHLLPRLEKQCEHVSAPTSRILLHTSGRFRPTWLCIDILSIHIEESPGAEIGTSKPGETCYDDRSPWLPSSQISPHSSNSRTPSAVIATPCGGSPAPSNHPLTSA